MSKKIFRLLVVVPLLITLVACSAQKQASSAKQAGSQSPASTSQQQNPAGNLANQPVEDKLAFGILSLEGTDKAITAEQARTLLPLWKALKSLGASTTASSEEITALYKQIQEAMTADQVQAIKDMNLSPTDTQALMTKYGVQMPQPQGTPRAVGTPRAQSGSSSSGGQSAGMPGDPGAGGPMGGGFPPDGGMMGDPGGTTSSGQSLPQVTPPAGQPARGGMRGGMNLILVDPVIKLLQERAG